MNVQITNTVLSCYDELCGWAQRAEIDYPGFLDGEKDPGLIYTWRIPIAKSWNRLTCGYCHEHFEKDKVVGHCHLNKAVVDYYTGGMHLKTDMWEKMRLARSWRVLLIYARLFKMAIIASGIYKNNERKYE